MENIQKPPVLAATCDSRGFFIAEKVYSVILFVIQFYT
jgi:hypothetical protein